MTVSPDASAARRKAWCYFRNLAHAVYREIRHIGPPSDHDARLTVAVGPYALPALKCSEARKRLKGSSIFKQTSVARSTGEVLRPYVEITGVSPEDLVVLYDLPGWSPKYGGTKWAVITRTLIELRAALDAHDEVNTANACGRVCVLHHNSGALIPLRDEWKQRAYLREKWPLLCD